MAIRCLMRLEGVYAQTWGGAKAVFSCIYEHDNPEHKRFQKATPTGMAEFVIDNPAVVPDLVIGSYYHFDISPVKPTDGEVVKLAA